MPVCAQSWLRETLPARTGRTDVRGKIKDHLTQQKVQDELHKLTESLRSHAKIEVTL